MRIEKGERKYRAGGAFWHRSNAGWRGFNSFRCHLIEGEYDDSENDDYQDYDYSRGNLFFQVFNLLSLISGAPDIAPEFKLIEVVSSLAYLVSLHIFSVSIQEEDIEAVLMAGIGEVPVWVHCGGVLVPEGEIAPRIGSSSGFIPIDCINEPAALGGAVLRTIHSPAKFTARIIFRSTPAVETVVGDNRLPTIEPVCGIRGAKGWTPIDSPIFHIGLKRHSPGTSPGFPLALMEVIFVPILQVHQSCLPYVLEVG